MKIVMAGCVLEFISGVTEVSPGVFQMDGNPVQLKLYKDTTVGNHWLSKDYPIPTLKVSWMVRADDSQASDETHTKTFTSPKGEWTWTAGLGETSELNTLLGKTIKDAYFVGYFLLEAEFPFKYGDARINAHVCALLKKPEQKAA